MYVKIRLEPYQSYGFGRMDYRVDMECVVNDKRYGTFFYVYEEQVLATGMIDAMIDAATRELKRTIREAFPIEEPKPKIEKKLPILEG